MANHVRAQAIGGESVDMENVCTVGDVKRRMGLEGYSAAVNGSPKSDSASLADYAYVTLSPPVKGGRI